MITAGDYAGAELIYRTWPLRDVLERYLSVLQEKARREYEVLVLAWAPRAAMGSKEKPPKPPDILQW